MGLKVDVGGGTWKTVPLTVKYSTDGGTTWYKADQTNFLDPVTGDYMKGCWANTAPPDIVSPSVSIDPVTKVATATWSQVTDSEGDFLTLYIRKAVTGGSTTETSVAYSTLTHPAGVTTVNLGALTEIGYTELTFSFKIVDAGALEGNYVAAAAVRIPPSDPTSVAINPYWNGSTYVGRVTWSPPGSGTISSYRVVWTRNGGGGGTINGATSPTDLATGVVPIDVLSATVYSIDPASTASPGVNVTMTVPPGVPTSVALSNMNTATATLSWSAPSSGAVTGYRYRFSTNGGSTYGSWTSVGSGTLSTTYSIVGLDTLYAQVEALNTSSTPQTNSYTVTTNATVVPPTPATPTASISLNTSISVDWAGSATTNVSTWTVQTKLNGAGSWTDAQTGIAVGTTSTTLSGLTLTNNTSQKVRVVAVYAANGQTAAGASKDMTSPSTLAAPTAKFLAGKASATWTHLSGNTGYYIVVTNAGTGATIESTSVGAVGTWTSSSAASYAEWTTYRIRVQGYGADGTAGQVYSSTNVRKIPNPLVISADNGRTFLDGYPWTESSSHPPDSNTGDKDLLSGSGWSGTVFGAMYYGTKFYDYLNSAVNGYSVTITSATVFCQRLQTGTSSLIAPVIVAHTHATYNSGSSPQTGCSAGYALPTGLRYNAYDPAAKTANEEMIDGGNLQSLLNAVIAGTYRGFGFYTTSYALLTLKYTGYVYSGSGADGTTGTFTITHDG